MGTPRDGLKLLLLTFAAVGCFVFLWFGIFAYRWLAEPDCVEVKSQSECLGDIRYLVDELDKQNVSLDDYDLYRVGSAYYMSCPADDARFEWLESYLGLKELDPGHKQVANLYQSVSQTPIIMPQKASARFYEGITGSLEDNFFIVAYDKTEGYFVIWFHYWF
jgi:hypothetical protein